MCSSVQINASILNLDEQLRLEVPVRINLHSPNREVLLSHSRNVAHRVGCTVS